MKSEITWSTAIPQPVIAIPVWPVATNADSRPRARAAASSSSVTDILPIAQSEPTVWTTCTSGRLAGPAGTLSPGGDARRSRSSTPAAAAASDSSGSSASTVCSPASTCIPASIASSSAARHSSVSAPPNGATPITSTFAPSSTASATLPTIGTARRA